MNRIRRTFLALTVASTAGVGLLQPATANTPGTPTYVALGDSYTAAPLAGLPTSAPPGCTQTQANYPHLVAPVLDDLTLVDVSCGGATTDHVFAPQQILGGTNPAQLEAVTAGARVVSFTFGGNDIGFGEIVQNCMSPLPAGSPCQDRYVVDGVDELATRIEATAPKVDRVLDAIRGRAPRAEVFVVGYPSAIPDSGVGCWPVVPATDDDTAYLRDTFRRLNAMLAEQAARNGATYVDTYTPSIGHDYCQMPGVKWIEGLVPTEPASPFHPNARGERGFADAVLRAMIRARV